MDRTAVAKQLVGLAKELLAVDADLEAVAEVVKNTSFMLLRKPLEKLGIGKANLFDGESNAGYYWYIKTRRGKTIVVVSKKSADVGPQDIVVGDLVVGYI